MRRIVHLGMVVLGLWLALAVRVAAEESPRMNCELSSRKVGLEDTFTLTVTIIGGDEALVPDFSQMKSFRQLGVAQGDELQIIQGKVHHRRSFIYTLKPEKLGVHVLPRISCRTGEGVLQGPLLKVEVVKGSTAPPAPRGGQSLLGPDPLQGPDLLDDIRSRRSRPVQMRLNATVDQEHPYEGQGILYTVFLETPEEIVSVTAEDVPSFSGFWKEPVPGAKTVVGVPVEGRESWRSYPVWKVLLFPQTSGKLKLPGQPFSILLPPDPASFFSSSRSVRRTLPGRQVQVEPLPETARGLPIGRFVVQAEPLPERVVLQKLVAWHWTVRGTGNLKVFPVDLGEGNGFRAFPARTEVRYFFDREPWEGQLDVEIPLTFERSGTVVVPHREIRTFDPAAGRIEVLRVPGGTVQVQGSATLPRSADQTSEAVRQGAAALPRPTVLILEHPGPSLRHLEVDSRYWMLWAFPLVLVLCGRVVQVRVLPHLRLGEKSRRRSMLREISRELLALKQASGIYPLLERFLVEYCQLRRADLHAPGVQGFLEGHQVARADVVAFLEWLADAQMARFAERKDLLDPGRIRAWIHLMEKLAREMEP